MKIILEKKLIIHNFFCRVLFVNKEGKEHQHDTEFLNQEEFDVTKGFYEDLAKHLDFEFEIKE